MKKKNELGIKQKIMSGLKKYLTICRMHNRKVAYITNTNKRRFMLLMFTAFKNTCHKQAMDRVKRDTDLYKRELQREKLSALTSKVD
jgi:nitrogenase subunit NifH